MLAPTIKLNNGREMPILGLGTWRSNEREAEESVKHAIDCGYRHIDTAYVYENEDEVGRGINAKINDGVVTREELFITSKLAGIHHEPKLVEHACRLSLKKLGLDYLDLYLIHFPVGMQYVSDNILHPATRSGEAALSDVDYIDTWKAMEGLVTAGLVRSIGLSNFNSKQTDRVLKICTIKPVTNQVECHPGFNQKKLIEFSKKHGIIITAYCPLARPRPDRQWPPFIYDESVKAKAEKHGKNAAQFCLRYLIDIGVVPIPKSVTKDRIKSNFDVFDFKLNQEEIEFMDKYDTNQRMIPFTGLMSHSYYPFNTPF